jgi:Ala-tRNA(Pro) deacylase
MDMSPTLLTRLVEQNIPYDTVHHRHSVSSLNTAHTAHIPAKNLVKSVLLHDEQGYMMALVASNRYVYISKLNDLLNRRLELASEEECRELFNDCESGAIPPVGTAYGIQTVIDRDLQDCGEIYIESGNHEDLIHMSGEAFHKLLPSCSYVDITVH